MSWGTLGLGAFVFVVVVLPIVIRLLEAFHKAGKEKQETRRP